MTGKFLDEMVKKRTGKVQIFMVLFFIFFGIGLCQNNNPTDDDEKKLREEIIALYQSKGDPGVRDFVNKKKDKITHKFIEDFTEAGVKERKKEWLIVCEIIAEEKSDKKNLADVYLKIGEYFRLTSFYKNATDYFDRALNIYQKLNENKEN